MLLHIGHIAKICGSGEVWGCLGCSEFSTEGGNQGGIRFFYSMPPRCVSADHPDTGIFLKKAGWCGPPDKTEKASNCLVPKEKEGGTKILGLNFIFNSKKTGISCHINLKIEETGQ